MSPVAVPGIFGAERRNQLPAYQAAVLADNPVMYWTLDETSGATCTDHSPSGFTGTCNGTFTRNVAAHAGLGVAVTLGGTTADNITTPDVAALDITGDFTYECWVKIASAATSQYLMSKGRTDASNAGYGMYITTARKIDIDQTEIAFIMLSTGTVTLSTWTHVVATRASNVFTVYLQGSAAGTATVGQAIQATNRAFTVGGANSAGTIVFPLSGQIDEVAVYNAALSSGRVLAHFNAAV